ncbi:MAG TPA: toxin, partial [Acidobacteria bacterium]|nr:toxin [Acidobacteriota bacterium]
MSARKSRSAEPAATHLTASSPPQPPRPGAARRDPTAGRSAGARLAEDFRIEPPSVSLPKGGGAISGMGEKLTANPVTGTGDMSLPLPLTAGRGGVTPSVALSYSSGGGNSPFGLGWSVNLPSFRRKTDKGIPRYFDEGEQADTIVLSDAEDLVPLLEESGGVWAPPTPRTDTYGGETWTITLYRPRIEGGFSLIERWKSTTTGRIWWRTISRDNIHRIYGRSDQARLVNPDKTTEVFEWLLEEESDQAGNVISYQYKAEDRVGIDTAQIAEHSRGNAGSQVAYRYLKRISYGNTVMGNNPNDGLASAFYDPSTPGEVIGQPSSNAGTFRFHLVFDYGEHDTADPELHPTGTWAARQDPFSRFRSGFDIRCYRLCQRVLMFHVFTELRDNAGAAVPVVVRSLELTHTQRPTTTTLASGQRKGWSWTGSSYTTTTLPATRFTYSQPTIDETVRLVTGLDDLPSGLDMRQWQWVDLDGEGLTGLLTEQGGSLYYKRNEGSGQLAPARELPRQPNLSLRGAGVRLVDLDGDGNLDMVVMRRGMNGFYARDADNDSWERFRPFRQVPSHTPDNPDVRLIDLSGDGHADILVTEDEVFTWYPSKAREGFARSYRKPMSRNEDSGPRLIFSRQSEQIFLADMTGDGLTDLVRIRNGSVCYWPNKGYATFGAKIYMRGAPRFDRTAQFDPRRIRLADVDGSGPTDLIYIGRDGVSIWFNESGNGFSAATTLSRFPSTASSNNIQVADLRGDGTACLVWSSPLMRENLSPLRYVKLMAEGKPWLLIGTDNGLGRTTTLTYTPSTTFYTADRRAGQPWATRLPFPVQCLSKVESFDAVTGWRLVNEYAYHHGYFDGQDREFRGFGMVEQWDTETFADFDADSPQHDPDIITQAKPVRTRTWLHTGAWRKGDTLTSAFAAEYFSGDAAAPHLPAPTLPAGLSPAEEREACRALRGQLLRSEVYAEDGSGNLDILYTVSEQTFTIKQLQPSNGKHAPSFHMVAGQSLSLSYDLDISPTSTDVPDPRTSQSLTLQVDDYGTVLRSAAVVYPRRPVSGVVHDTEQTTAAVVITESEVVHQDAQADSDNLWRLGVPTQSRSWEFVGKIAVDGGADVLSDAMLDDSVLADPDVLNTAFTDASLTSLSYEGTTTATTYKRLLGHQAVLYWSDGLTASLALGSVGVRAIAYQKYALAYTDQLVTDLYAARVTATMLTDGGYIDLGIDPADGSAATTACWWLPSGRTTLDATAFYQPTQHVDPFGNTTTLTWDSHGLMLSTVESPPAAGSVGMTVTATLDYRLMAPSKVTDPNGTESAATFDALGRVLTTAIRNTGDGDATTSHSIEFAYNTDSIPASVHSRARKTYGGTDWQETYAYSDGGGNVVQTKVQAAPGDAPTITSGTVTWAHADPRYIGTGRTVLDNKGNVVKQYEPFFSTTADYEDETELVEWGKAVVYGYDPIGRNTAVTLPDGSVRSWRYTPWKVEAADEEDNLAGGDHEGTPAVTHRDAMGRVTKQVVTPDGSTEHAITLELDVQGNVLTVTDPRGNDIEVQRFDLLGRACFTGAADEGYDGSSGDGETTVFFAADSQPIRTWRSGGLTLRRRFDALRRPLGLYIDEGSGERLVQQRFYGDGLSDASAYSQGRPVRIYDTAGEQRLAYDFRGRLTEQIRTVIDDITAEADWSGLAGMTSLADIDAWLATDGGLDSETFATTTSYDALDRVTEQVAPDGSRVVPTYDAGGRLAAVEVYVRGATSPTSFVTEIMYNARGQRESITYGNHTATSYTYDEDRFWLSRLVTERSSASSHGAATLQDLGYARDRVGNITSITDDAQETVFFGNAQVSPTRRFGYDSLYRLVQATGREKTGQSQFTAWYADYAGAMGAIPDLGDPALRRYTQRYTYDAADNITEMKHQQGSDGTVLWRRGYAYETGNNQLLSSSLPGDDPDDPATHSDTYTYTARGAMAALPHLGAITRDFRDQLRKVVLDSAGNVAWYAYSADGQRVRKVVDKGSVVEERIYVGGYEVWRKKNGSGTVQEERQTLHVMDDRRRIAMVET